VNLLATEHLGAAVTASHSVDWFHQLPQNFIIGLQQGALYSLVALGYTLVYGVLQLINFAHSEVFMSGGFGSFLIVNAIVSHMHVSGAMVWFTVAAGIVSGAFVGAGIAWALEKTAYKPLRKRGAPKLAFLISAIGASLFLANLAGKLFNHLSNNPFPTYFNTDRVLFTIGTAKIRLLVLIMHCLILHLALLELRCVLKGRLGAALLGYICYLSDNDMAGWTHLLGRGHILVLIDAGAASGVETPSARSPSSMSIGLGVETIVMLSCTVCDASSRRFCPWGTEVFVAVSVGGEPGAED